MSAVVTRYSQALLDVAQEAKKSLTTLSDHLSLWLQVSAQSPELKQALETPNIDAKEKAEILNQIGGRLGLDPLILNLLKVLSQNQRYAHVGSIALEFKRLSLAAEGKLLGELTSADPLSAMELTEITKAASKKLGRPVVFVQKTDPALLGGFVAKVAETTFDGSIRGQLNRLKTQLLS